MRVGRRQNRRKKVDNRVLMKIAPLMVVVFLSAAGLAAQSRSGAPPAGARSDRDVVYEGELETYVAIGGESTGWRMRTRTPEGRRQFIELLLTADLARGARANSRIRVRGTMQTRHYPERGDVQVLAVKELIEIARR
jgi:hypothetical protein